MAALIVAIGVMAVLWSVALPTWRQLAIREKEEELVFRGTQYARAIGLYQRRFANASPPSLDVLIDQRFLRTKYKDPMTADGEFQLLYLTPNQPGSSAGAGPGQTPQTPASNLTTARVSATQPTGGIIGVASKSTETSLRVYNGRTKYNEWQFIYLATTAQPGGGAQGAAGGSGAGDIGGRGRAGRGRGDDGRGDRRGGMGGRGGAGRGPGRAPVEPEFGCGGFPDPDDDLEP